MKIAIAAALAALMLAGAAHARPSHHYRHHVSRDYYGDSSSDYYTNVSGHHVHRPVYAKRRPAGASAHCSDGSFSFSEHARGTCSHHGGVAEWY